MFLCKTLSPFCCFSLREEDFKWFLFINSYIKTQLYIIAPQYPRGSWFKQTWNFTPWGWFYTSFNFSGQIVFLEDFLRFSLFYPHVKIQTPLWPHPIPGDHGLNFENTLPASARFRFLAKWFSKRRIFKND